MRIRRHLQRQRIEDRAWTENYEERHKQMDYREIDTQLCGMKEHQGEGAEDGQEESGREQEESDKAQEERVLSTDLLSVLPRWRGERIAEVTEN